MYDHTEVDPPIRDSREFDNKPPFYKSVFERNSYAAEDDLSGEKPWACSSNMQLEDDDYSTFVRSYWAMVSLMDFHIGRIVDHLKQCGLLENTMIIFTSDHGEYLGNHGFWWKWLMGYEDIHKVPFLVVDPDCTTRGMRSSAMQSLIDVPQTLMKRCGVGIEPGIQGVDQTVAWRDSSQRVRDKALIEFRPTEGPYAQQTLITEKWKLIVYANREYGELYDLEEDPEQMINLWDAPSFLEVKSRLMLHMLSAEMEKEGVLRERTMWA